MHSNKRGRQSMIFPDAPVITVWSSVAGKKEKEGPLGHLFDRTSCDTHFGQKSWELAEKEMQTQAMDILLKKAGLERSDLGAVFSGDLLNQCIGSSFPLRNTGVPHVGLYGACSTMAESLLLASMAVSGGFAQPVVAQTSSHFASSERQYRFPLGYGGQRAPTSQWTVTGSGAVLLASEGRGPQVECATIGCVTDLGITDAANMGAAMAPAAFSTIRAHFQDLGRSIDDYDFVFTGDLGCVGHDALIALAKSEALHWQDKLVDCGMLIFDRESQDVHSGGSGCGCGAITLCAHILPQLQRGSWKRVLFCGTGALLSPTSTQQGLPVPGVCHAVAIVKGEENGIS